MLKTLALFVIIFIAISALNLLAWLFVMGVDVTTIGSGRSKFSSDVRVLLHTADRIYPFVEMILSVHRKVGDLFGLRKYYFLSWILTVFLESLLATVSLYGLMKLRRFIAFSRR